MLRSTSADAQLAAFQEGLSSMKLVSYNPEMRTLYSHSCELFISKLKSFISKICSQWQFQCSEMLLSQLTFPPQRKRHALLNPLSRHLQSVIENRLRRR
jgi:hypothetical protein